MGKRLSSSRAPGDVSADGVGSSPATGEQRDSAVEGVVLGDGLPLRSPVWPGGSQPTSSGRPFRPSLSDDIPYGVLLVAKPTWRIVRVEQSGAIVKHVLEVKETPDAMGNERWRPFIINSKTLEEMFNYTVELATILHDRESQ